MKLKDIEDLGGVWKCYINGMQNHTAKVDLETFEVVHFAEKHSHEVFETSCEYIVKVLFNDTIDYEFRNNHYARKHEL